jgi:hypothetical protein
MSKKPKATLPIAKSSPVAKAGGPKPSQKAASGPVPVTIVSSGNMEGSGNTDTPEMRKYRAQNALRDIERAEAHKSDKGLMGDVKKLAADKIDCLKKIC